VLSIHWKRGVLPLQRGATVYKQPSRMYFTSMLEHRLPVWERTPPTVVYSYRHRVRFSSPVNRCYLQAWQIHLYKFAPTKTFWVVLWIELDVTLVDIVRSFIVRPYFIRNEARGALGHVECNLMNECWTLADPFKFTLAFLNMPLCIEWPHGH